MPFDDALDTLYEPNAVFSQFLGSASTTFFLFSFPYFLFLSCLLSLFLSVLSCHFFSLISFFVFFFCFLLFSFISFPFSSYLFFISFFQLTCVCRAYAQ